MPMIAPNIIYNYHADFITAIVNCAGIRSQVILLAETRHNKSRNDPCTKIFGHPSEWKLELDKDVAFVWLYLPAFLWH